MPFKPDFAWGVATAAYQIEGAHDADGRGPSVWDQMSHAAGRTFEGDTGDVACDHYHRIDEDVALMREMGLKAYRFSISWTRVLPDGVGRANEAGLAFYDRLIDALLENGIEPWVTLFHWDYPLALYRRGGWLNRASVEWFADYTKLIVDRLGDRVANWITLNEPQCFIGLGHREGVHAPGLKLDWPDVLTAAHHALMAHGRAVEVIRESAKRTPRVGFAPVGCVKYPHANDAANVGAAREAFFAVDKPSLWNNTWWSEPTLRGHYPEDGLRAFGDMMPTFDAGDLRTMHQPLDFYGVNIYQGDPIRADGSVAVRPPGFPRTMIHWPVEPDSLYWGPRFLHERYGLPIVIAENGMSSHDWIDLDGAVNDAARIDFTRRYLLRLRDAADDGVDVDAYFHWSLMDNFEWAEGYKHRFGLIHVDMQTGRRTPKASARWYRSVIDSNGETLAHRDRGAQHGGPRRHPVAPVI